MAWDVLEGAPGAERRDELEEIYLAARRCEGIVLLVRPSIRETISAALGTLECGTNPGPARLYVVEADRAQLALLIRELSKRSLANEATLYHGSLRDLFRDLPLHPGLICTALDFEASEQLLLKAEFPAHTPVLILRAPKGGSQGALQRLISAGILERTGGCPAYRTTRQCNGTGCVPPTALRLALQGRLHERYFLSEFNTQTSYTPVADLTEEIRRDFSVRSPGASGYGKWPYVVLEHAELPLTLPGGKAWPKISVITPSFNQGKYIEQTILSVLHQGYPNVEHIIVDGASTDGTSQVLDRYRDKVALITSEPDRGQSDAINKGMARASGQILTWINSDDMLAPGALAAMAMAFETSGADMVAGICQLYRDGRLVNQHLTSCPDGPLNLNDLLDLDDCWNEGQFFHQPEVMFTQELWVRSGGHVKETLHYSMDYEMWLRFAKAGANLHVIGRPIAWFRVHDEQKTYLPSNFLPELVACRDAFAKEHRIALRPSLNVLAKPSKLRITLLNDHGGFYGAGIAHVRLGRALARAGHDVNLVSILDNPNSGAEFGDYTTQSVVNRVGASNPDLVIVGNLHNAKVDPMLLHLLSERYLTLVVLHDFWTLTGRCGYTGDCEKYLTGCDATCPTPDEYPALAPAEIAESWSKKRAILGAARRPVLLANSQWTAEFARNAFANGSGGDVPSIDICQLSFPLDIFRPRDRRACRETLGLPLDRFIILLPASLEDQRKGGTPLLNALSRLELPDVLVVTLGAVAQGVEAGIDLVQLGFIYDQPRVAMLYSAADLVVGPSTSETFGQVFIEAIACGTPVAGYAVAGVREAIRDGITGVLAADIDPSCLASAVQYLYNRPDLRRDMTHWGRSFVENEWSEFSAYRHLFLALRRLANADVFKLKPKISFLPDTPAPPRRESVWRGSCAWRPRHGFSVVESAPRHGLDDFRWAFGPDAFAEISADTRGIHTVVIGYRNPHDAQHLIMRCNGVAVGAYDLPNTGLETGRFVLQDVSLEAGVNLLHLKFSKWYESGSESRPLAVIVTEILAERVHNENYPDQQLDADKMVATVWGGSAR
uniref:Glycosyl transferase, family 2 n=1 Tax=Solibacter usitatus (strain Ellin6076) TaxID=234267 RepID=Q02BE6_SOLUE